MKSTVGTNFDIATSKSYVIREAKEPSHHRFLSAVGIDKPCPLSSPIPPRFNDTRCPSATTPHPRRGEAELDVVPPICDLSRSISCIFQIGPRCLPARALDRSPFPRGHQRREAHPDPAPAAAPPTNRLRCRPEPIEPESQSPRSGATVTTCLCSNTRYIALSPGIAHRLGRSPSSLLHNIPPP